MIQFAGNNPAGTTTLDGMLLPLFPPGTLNPKLARFKTVPRSPDTIDAATLTVPVAPVPVPLKTLIRLARVA